MDEGFLPGLEMTTPGRYIPRRDPNEIRYTRHTGPVMRCMDCIDEAKAGVRDTVLPAAPARTRGDHSILLCNYHKEKRTTEEALRP